MPHILMATTDPAPSRGAAADDDRGVLAAALRAGGADVAIATWDDPDVAWDAADAVLVRSVSHHPDRRDELVAWAAAVGATTTVLPAADVVRWNTHKGYLLELEDRGAPLVPTAWLGAGDEVELAAVAADRGWSAVVAKPAVGAGSHGLLVAEDPAAAQAAFAALLADHDVLVQPLLARVASDGELSVVVVDGVCSHVVRTRPGERQVQVAGGAGDDVDPDTARLAEWVVAATAAEPVVARVDLLPADDGTWQLLEVELVGAALDLARAPGSADRLAAALLARLAGPVG